MLKKWYNIREVGRVPICRKENKYMRALGQIDDNVIDAEHWREVDSGYRDDTKEGFRFEDIVRALKKPRSKKMTREELIARRWRLINWFIIWIICCMFITFLFEKTFFRLLPYIAPWIPWTEALKILVLYFAIDTAWNSSEETNKDKFRYITALALALIPTIIMLFTVKIVSIIRLFNLCIACGVCISAHKEKIYTDANVRRIPPKKKRKKLYKNKEGEIVFDEYDV